jgi:RimJ/RimL family protein N-acetyltransferase
MDVIIREARPEDAEQLILYVRRVVDEPGSNLELSPGEFTFTVLEEEEFLARAAQADNSVYLIAETNGTIVGGLNCSGGTRRAVRHAVVLGITVDHAWRGQGLGTSLMLRAIEWAQGTGIVKRIELFVLERNSAAIHLYQKLGFEVEGRRRKAIFRDGEYHDELMMGLLL